MFLSLPVEKVTSNRPITLEECVEAFCREEHLNGDECWHCPACNRLAEATKKFDIWKTPPILIIHLKRFEHDQQGCMSKIEDLVQFPVTDFGIENFVYGPRRQQPTACVYDLYSVIRHSGSLSNGHYTAVVQNGTGNWYEVNDDRSHQIPASEIVDKTAYVCFYTRMVRQSWYPAGQ